jgi:hypothetical protein
MTTQNTNSFLTRFISTCCLSLFALVIPACEGGETLDLDDPAAELRYLNVDETETIITSDLTLYPTDGGETFEDWRLSGYVSLIECQDGSANCRACGGNWVPSMCKRVNWYGGCLEYTEAFCNVAR